MGQMAEHRVSMLGSSLRRFEDPAHSADPRIRDIVAGLRTLEMAPPPRAHFRAELRAQLVAVAPRLVAEGMAAEAPPLPRGAVLERPRPRPVRDVSQPTGLRRVLAKLGQLPVSRPLGIVTAVITVFAMLLAGAVVLSRRALPGDALYGLKRASENVELSLASGPTDKANLLLGFAKTRADEVNSLLARADASALAVGANASAGISTHTASLIKSTLESANTDVTQASQLLGNAAVRDKSSKPLAILAAWTPGQARRLSEAARRIPAGSLHNLAVSSVDLVRAAQLRATDLTPQVGCGCLSNGSSDSLGPLPCPKCVASAPSAPGPNGPSSSSPGTSGSTSAPPAGGVNGGSQSSEGTPVPPSSSTSGPLITVPSLSLPSLSLPSVSTPVNVDSCGVSASLGPINIGIGPCGVHLGL